MSETDSRILYRYAVQIRDLALNLPRKSDRDTAQEIADGLHALGVRLQAGASTPDGTRQRGVDPDD